MRDGIVAGLSMVIASIVLVAILSVCGLAYGRDNGQWGDADPIVKAWISKLKMPDNPLMSCCGEADAYWADSYEVGPNGEYVAIITDERDVPGRLPREVGTKVVIPKSKIKWDQGNPSGHGWVFISPGNILYCYLPPGGV